MTLPQVFDLFSYWESCPPEHEMLVMLAQVYTTWKPAQKPVTPEEHMASLEARWNAGALNVRDLFRGRGLLSGHDSGAPPGIGPFPTVH